MRSRIDDIPFCYFRNNATEYLNELFEKFKFRQIEWRNFDPKLEAKKISDVYAKKNRIVVPNTANPLFFYANEIQKNTAIEALEQLGLKYKIHETSQSIEVTDMYERYIKDCQRMLAFLLYDYINTINIDFPLDKKVDEIISATNNTEIAIYPVFTMLFNSYPISFTFYDLHNETFPSAPIRDLIPEYNENKLENFIDDQGSEAGVELLDNKIFATGDYKIGSINLIDLANFTSEAKREPEKVNKLLFFNMLSSVTKFPSGVNSIIVDYHLSDIQQYIDDHTNLQKGTFEISLADLRKLYSTSYSKKLMSDEDKPDIQPSTR